MPAEGSLETQGVADGRRSAARLAERGLEGSVTDPAGREVPAAFGPHRDRRRAAAARLGPRPGQRSDRWRSPTRSWPTSAGLAEQIIPTGRGDAFADEVAPAAGAGALDRLAAYSGRRPWRSRPDGSLLGEVLERGPRKNQARSRERHSTVPGGNLRAVRRCRGPMSPFSKTGLRVVPTVRNSSPTWSRSPGTGWRDLGPPLLGRRPFPGASAFETVYPVDPLDLARWQFGIITVYHFLFVPITIGLSAIVAGYETAWVRTQNPQWLRLTKFFGKLFLINFAIGVVDRDRAGVPVRDELERLLPLRRRHLRCAAGRRGPAGVLPGVDVPRPVDLRLGPALAEAPQRPASGWCTSARCSRRTSSWPRTPGCSTRWATPTTRRPAARSCTTSSRCCSTRSSSSPSRTSCCRRT